MTWRVIKERVIESCVNLHFKFSIVKLPIGHQPVRLGLVIGFF